MTLEEKIKVAPSVKPEWLAGMSKDEVDAIVRNAKWTAVFRIARVESRLSQAKVAGQLGVSRRALGRWERGENIDLLPVSKIVQLADIVGIKIGWIYDGGYLTTNTIYCADGTYRKEMLPSYVNAIFNGEVD